MLHMSMLLALIAWEAPWPVTPLSSSAETVQQQIASPEASEPLPVVENLELPRLYGSFYEIGTYLLNLEKGCSNSVLSFAAGEQPHTAALTLECDRGFFHPQVSGEAVPIDEHVLARTIATFHVPFNKDFVEEFDVIMLADDDSWVVIGHPQRKLLWIFSRSPELPTSTLRGILDHVESDLGYNGVRDRLTCTKQDRGHINLCKEALKHSLFDDFRRLFGQ